MEFKRTDRLNTLIQREISNIIQREIESDSNIGILTVNYVKISKDLSYADIYVNFLSLKDDASDEIKLEMLKEKSGLLRSLLSKELKDLRKTPLLRFHIDTGIINSRKIDEIIKGIKKNNFSNNPNA